MFYLLLLTNGVPTDRSLPGISFQLSTAPVAGAAQHSTGSHACFRGPWLQHYMQARRRGLHIPERPAPDARCAPQCFCHEALHRRFLLEAPLHLIGNELKAGPATFYQVEDTCVSMSCYGAWLGAEACC